MDLELLRLTEPEIPDADVRDLEDRWREQPEREQRPAPRAVKVRALTGCRVRNPAGEPLGRIVEIMLDAGGGIAYAALAYGGRLHRKLFAVPWYALTRNEAQREFILNVERRSLDENPGFDRKRWPEAADISWMTRR